MMINQAMATRQRICRIRVLAKNLPFLSNSSTRQNGLFGKLVGLTRLADICRAVLRGLARLAKIRQVVLCGLARLAHIRQPGLLGLAKLAKGNFGKCYANLASLASLVSLENLASVG
jgi:hypothetical protein